MLKGERCLSLDPMAGHKIVNGVLFPSRLAWELLAARASIRHRDPGQADSQDEVALPRTVLDLVAGTPSETEIRVTHGNSDAYEGWCERLNFIRNAYFPNSRVVDIERGFFEMIQNGSVMPTAVILREA